MSRKKAPMGDNADFWTRKRVEMATAFCRSYISSKEEEIPSPGGFTDSGSQWMSEEELRPASPTPSKRACDARQTADEV